MYSRDGAALMVGESLIPSAVCSACEGKGIIEKMELILSEGDDPLP